MGERPLRALGFAAAGFVFAVLIFLILRPFSPPAPTPQQPLVASPRQGEFSQLADDVLNGMDRAFAKVDMVECGRGREASAEDFDVAVARLCRYIPPGTDDTVDSFVRAAVTAVSQLKHLCFEASIGQLGASKISIEEIYKEREKAVELFRSHRESARRK